MLDQILVTAVLRDLVAQLKLKMAVLNFVKELAVAPRLTAYCVQCLASTRRESAHSIDRAAAHDAASSRFVCFGGGLHTMLEQVPRRRPWLVVCAPVIRRISASHKLVEALCASASARSDYPMKGRAWQTALQPKPMCLNSEQQATV